MSIDNIHVSTRNEFISLAKARGIAPSTLMAHNLEQLLKLKLANMASLNSLNVSCKDNHVKVHGTKHYFNGLQCKITVHTNGLKIQATPASNVILKELHISHKKTLGFSKKMIKSLSKDLSYLCKMHDVSLSLEHKEKSQIISGNNKLYPNIYLIAHCRNKSATKDLKYIFQVLFVLIQLTNIIVRNSNRYFTN